MTTTQWIILIVALVVIIGGGVTFGLLLSNPARLEVVKKSTRRIVAVGWRRVSPLISLALPALKRWWKKKAGEKDADEPRRWVGSVVRGLIFVAIAYLAYLYYSPSIGISVPWKKVGVVLGIVALIAFITWLAWGNWESVSTGTTSLGSSFLGTVMKWFVAATAIALFIYFIPRIAIGIASLLPNDNELTVVRSEWTKWKRIPPGQGARWSPHGNVAYQVEVELRDGSTKIYKKARILAAELGDECAEQIHFKERPVLAFRLRLIDPEIEKATFSLRFVRAGSGPKCDGPSQAEEDAARLLAALVPKLGPPQTIPPTLATPPDFLRMVIYGE